MDGSVFGAASAGDFAIEFLADDVAVHGFAVSTAQATEYFDFDSDVLDALLSTPGIVMCNDMRVVERLGTKQPDRLVDIRLLVGPDVSMRSIARDARLRDLSYLEERVACHVRACKTAKLDMRTISIVDAVPRRLLEGLTRARADGIRVTVDGLIRGDQTSLERYERDVLPFARTLHLIERNCIKIDESYVAAQLAMEHKPADAACFRSIAGLQRGGFVRTLLTSVGGKTGRIRIEKGFNCMGVPHGPARDAIVSRFDGGKVFAFDFNAIDYRCIVQSIGKPFSDLYAGCRDFHARTTSFLFGDAGVNAMRRDIVKKITYIYMYGGSKDTLKMKTMLSEEKLEEVLRKLDSKLGPIREFRRELFERSTADGYVTLPKGGRRVSTSGDRDMHDGKVIGLFAQTFSSYVFEKAVTNVVRTMDSMKSKLIFTVHDEVVVDMHPDEFGAASSLAKEMESSVDGFEFVVNVKSGRTYGDATAR